MILLDTPFVEGFGASWESSDVCRGGASPWTEQKKKIVSNDNILDCEGLDDLTGMEHLR